MKRLTIMVDMDDTIENLLEEWVHTLNRDNHRYVMLNDIHSWDLGKAYPGLSQEQIHKPLFTEELWDHVRPKWDAVNYLKKLKDEGHNIYITTSSNFKTIYTKLNAVLARYFPFISMDHVIVCTKKQMIRGDVMVDDAPHNLENGEYVQILMSAPHNRDYNAEAHGMYRVSNWSEVYDIIQCLSRADEQKE